MSSDDVKDAATLAAGTLVSRLLGFARDLLIAYALGPAADAFLLAFRLPNVFRRLLAEGSLGMLHAAAEARIRAERGAAAAQDFARSVSFRFFLLALPICLLLLLSAPLIVFLLAPGAHSAILDRAANLFRLCLPYLPLCLAAAIAFAHAANTGSFRPQAWAPALFNIPLLLCASAALMLRPETGVAEVLLCLGVVGGGLAQALAGLRCLGPVRFSAPDTRDMAAFFFGPPEVRDILKKIPASAPGAAPHQIHILAGLILASFLAPGGISALYFAERLVELPLSIAGAAVGIAALPRFSALAAEKDWHGFSETLGQSIRMGAFLSFPAAAGLFALAYPISALLFGHGAYAGDPAAITAAALCGYALGLPALCAARPLLAAAHALRLEKIPLKTALASLGLLIPVSIGFFLISDSPASAALSVGLGLSAGACCNALLLWRHVSIALRAESANEGKALRKFGAACLVYLAAALVMAFCLTWAAQDMSILVLPGLILAAVVLWFAGFLAFRSEDARALAALFHKK